MYGFSTSRLAASMTRLTRLRAGAGGISRPSNSGALSGGGGGGSNVAPPLVGSVSALAVPVRTGASRQANAKTAQRNDFELTEGDILFRTPAGLADGLALKELARLPPHGRFAPVVSHH